MTICTSATDQRGNQDGAFVVEQAPVNNDIPITMEAITEELQSTAVQNWIKALASFQVLGSPVILGGLSSQEQKPLWEARVKGLAKVSRLFRAIQKTTTTSGVDWNRALSVRQVLTKEATLLWIIHDAEAPAGPGLSDRHKRAGGGYRQDDGSWSSWQWDQKWDNQVGLLSSLVLAAGAWGAWASHVWVDSEEASKGGREVWGLPTSQCDISMQTSDEDGKVLGFGFAPLLHVGDGCGPLGRVDRSARVTVGHLPWMDKASSRVDVTLPNLSGGLSDGRSGYTDLLSYPLRLQARSWRLLPGAEVSGASGIVPRADVSQWLPLFSIELSDVEVNAGVPEKLKT
ncbi:hypothetical protein AK812_SmicGene21039 [Symbiodinium microadriaticum]|uniref:Uncharacterized protein n=1 Tax=Symbiodinium microadriaticum TaxID=2951 RepID=A0A1Q9DNC3_SYMMI|nr:hypothetical protein AK812_SmicGene21039 [Symbiodinium microadriaticum]CAE7890413.1 unnamed protein product [Symbiodinium microadriaticum]